MTAPASTLAAADAWAQQQQAQNAAQVAALTLALWMRSVQAENISESSSSWLEQAISYILRGRERSYQIAVAYSRAVREIQAPRATPFDVPRPPDPPREQLVRSLVFTGPRDLAVSLSRIPEEQPLEDPLGQGIPTREDTERGQRTREMRQRAIEDARKKAGVKAAGAAFRHTANAGRETTDLIVVRDPVALGFVRVTKDKPCAFCLMLASNGPVYQEDSFDESNARFEGPGEHKVHDSCACSLRPVYRRGKENWTDKAREADELWRQMLKDNPGIGGKKARNEFARLVRAAGIADLSRW